MTPTPVSNLLQSSRVPRCSAASGLLLAGLSLGFFAGGCGTTTTQRLGLAEPATVEAVDLERYLGTWYEIASFPQSFQKGCSETKADYSLLDNGDIRVRNECRVDGRAKTATGRAVVVDTETNAKLKVSFFEPFWGDYWILLLGDDYEYAAVGDPGRDSLWILAREPQLEEAILAEITEALRADGFEVERLETTALVE